MKKNNFTQSTILPLVQSLGYGYRIIDKDTLILETEKGVFQELKINRKEDSVTVNGKVYKSNQDRDLFTIFPKEENIKKYGNDWNPLCNVYYLFKWMEKNV